MKKMLKNLAAVIGYMLLLCLLLKAEAILLFSPRLIGMFLLGSMILCIPHMEKQVNNPAPRGGAKDPRGIRQLSKPTKGWLFARPLDSLLAGIKWRDFQRIFKRNAVTAGYLETFMLIFVSMMQKDIAQGEILAGLALDLRPVFYGFVCCVVLKEEDGDSHSEEEKEHLEHEEKHGILGEEHAGKDKPDFSKLTRQEKTVAGLVRQGLTNREIGEELCISEATVKKHMSSIFEKLEIESRKELKE